MIEREKVQRVIDIEISPFWSIPKTHLRTRKNHYIYVRFSYFRRLGNFELNKIRIYQWRRVQWADLVELANID